MAIPEEKLQLARTMLANASRPLFFHDDDCDGVSCFVMCYQFTKEGKGVCVKRNPTVTEDYLRKVEEFHPDLVVIMDKPNVDEEFFAGLRTPVLWIDHHEPQDVRQFSHVTYLNPRIWDDKDSRPTSYWVYLITRTNLWMAVVGSVGDWYLPEYIDDFKHEYPELLPKQYTRVEDLYLDSPLGQLIKVIQFNLKGSVTETRKSILTLTRIEHPREILEQTSSKGSYLWRKYRQHAAGYDRHLTRANRVGAEAKDVLLYEYEDSDQTYTSELSNELLIRYPDKIIMVCRKHDGKRKCSMRSKHSHLPDRIKKSLEGLDGRGGGHLNACGVVVADEDWETFWKRFTGSIRAS